MYNVEEIKLAKSCIETLEKLGEKECLECDGTGKAKVFIENRDKHPFDKDCPNCNGTGKIGWKWQPKVGEFGIKKLTGEIVLIIDTIPSIDKIFILQIKPRYGAYLNELISLVFKDTIIPILHWETIISVLKAFGFVMTVSLGQSGGQIRIYHRQRDEVSPSIIFDKMYSGKPQPAVMRAVIALRKEELKCQCIFQT